MAIKLEDKQNVTAPDAAFPFGDVKDNSGASDGTPLDRAVLSDYIQFFAKMLDASGVVANGLLESETDGFQYFEALQKLFVQSELGNQLITKVVEIGDWDMDADPSVDIAHGLGTDYKKTRGLSVIIRDDADASFFALPTIDASGNGNGGASLLSNGTDIRITRTTGGFLDSSLFNSTSFNRGWVTIVREV